MKVEKHPSKYTQSWRRFAEVNLQVVVFTNFYLKGSEKEHFVAKILLVL